MNWYYMGKQYRKYGLPIIVTANVRQFNREGELPNIITDDGYQSWKIRIGNMHKIIDITVSKSMDNIDKFIVD